MSTDERMRGQVIGVPVDAVSWEVATARILGWALQRASKYVAVCNVHVVISAVKDSNYFKVISEADLSIPDGAPVAWRLRSLGFAEQERLAGPDLMEKLIEKAAQNGVAIYLYGSTDVVLEMILRRLRREYPELLIAGAESPPFRALTESEDEAVVERINESNAGLVFVGLGCPKQERWMAAHRGRVNAVMLGVGAAFDFYAGASPRAPRFMQQHGLEWVHRLVHSPRRLGWRYLTTNFHFIFAIVRESLFPGRL